MKKILLIIMALTLVIVTGCSKSEDKIVIYSSLEIERNEILQRNLNKKFPDSNISVVYMSTGNSAAKIKTEKEDIEADIILGLELSHMENLKDNFADLSYYDDSYYKDNINPDHNKYLVYEKFYGSIIVDEDYFKKNKLEYPKTYEDLLKPEFKNKIAMSDPKTSGTGYMFYLNVYNEMGKEKALKYFDKLSKNIVQFTSSGSGPINLLNQGEAKIALGMTYQGVNEINKGAKYKLIELETNSPYNMTASSIIKGRENDKNVKEIFQYIMTDFSKFDKENYIPSNILKDEKNNIKNYPSIQNDANMNGFDDIELKNKLINEWMF